ncbi:XdhC family protein, partial [Streptomyces albogriseolus]
MLDIAEELDRWVAEGRDFAVATVVAVGGSAPRGAGAALAVDADGTAVGSVSGGCVEGAVYELCVRALEDGDPDHASVEEGQTGGQAIGMALTDVLPVHSRPPTSYISLKGGLTI